MAMINVLKILYPLLQGDTNYPVQAMSDTWLERVLNVQPFLNFLRERLDFGAIGSAVQRWQRSQVLSSRRPAACLSWAPSDDGI